MNTADRSIAHIDTALRRRFQFIEMMPNTEVLSTLGITTIDGIDIQQMLDTINSRIEILYDREHTLGHSFFIPLKERPDIDTLASIFQNQLFPLLEEYFFEDWEIIRRVLGDGKKGSKQLDFYRPTYTEGDISRLFQNQATETLADKVYMRNPSALTNPEAYIGVYATTTIDPG
jgi:5-methylcytosine-specific restriction protein B